MLTTTGIKLSVIAILNVSRVMNTVFASRAKTKAQISCAVIAQMIGAFVSATRILQFLLFLQIIFQDSSFILWLYRPVRDGPDRESRRPVFSRCGTM